MKLNHNQYLLIDTIGEGVTAYDDAGRLVANLITRKHTNHLSVIVLGTNGRAHHFPVPQPEEMEGFDKSLIATMNNLTH